MLGYFCLEVFGNLGERVFRVGKRVGEVVFFGLGSGVLLGVFWLVLFFFVYCFFLGFVEVVVFVSLIGFGRVGREREWRVLVKCS